MILRNRKKKNKETEEAVKDAAAAEIGAGAELANGAPIMDGVESDGLNGGAEFQTSCEECERLKVEISENHEKYLRALAEMENFKRRSIKERSDLMRYEGEKILVELLEVVDNFERALENIDSDPAQVKNGVELIYRGLAGVLDRFGVRAKPALGKPFDPNEHNALSRQEVEDSQEAGTVIHELKKAYFYKDKLLRPAEVVVSVLKEEKKEEPSQENEEVSS